MEEEIEFTCEYTGTIFKYTKGHIGAYQVINCPYSHIEDAGLTRCSKLEGWCEVVHPKPRTTHKKINIDSAIQGPAQLPGYEESTDSAIQGPPEI